MGILEFSTYFGKNKFAGNPPKVTIEQPVQEWVPEAIAKSQPGDCKVQTRGKL